MIDRQIEGKTKKLFNIVKGVYDDFDENDLRKCLKYK